MGGVVPLGYRVENRALHVVEQHAAFVFDLFRRYLEIGSVVQLKAILDQEDVRLPTDGQDHRRRAHQPGASLQDPVEPNLRRAAEVM